MSKKKSRKRPPPKMKDLLKPLWPSERDILERPDRYKYVRKLIKHEGCVFCEAERLGISFDSLVLFIGEKALVVMNKYPYNTGHLLILPRRHVGSFVEVSEEENIEMAELVRKSSAILLKELGCSGLNIGMNHGAVAGAGIPDHLHWHIVPRWAGDTNFFPLIAETKVLPESIEQSYQRLVQHFKELAK